MMPTGRGKSLEKSIRELFKRYTQLGIHCQRNYPERGPQGEYLGKHGFDFQVFHAGKFYAFDAKECHGSLWNFTTNAKLHQIKALFDIERQGGNGFFMVYFYNAGLNAISANHVVAWMAAGEHSVGFSESRKISLDFLGVLKHASDSGHQGEDQLLRDGEATGTPGDTAGPEVQEFSAECDQPDEPVDQ